MFVEHFAWYFAAFVRSGGLFLSPEMCWAMSESLREPYTVNFRKWPIQLRKERMQYLRTKTWGWFCEGLGSGKNAPSFGLEVNVLLGARGTRVREPREGTGSTRERAMNMWPVKYTNGRCIAAGKELQEVSPPIPLYQLSFYMRT